MTTLRACWANKNFCKKVPAAWAVGTFLAKESGNPADAREFEKKYKKSLRFSGKYAMLTVAYLRISVLRRRRRFLFWLIERDFTFTKEVQYAKHK